MYFLLFFCRGAQRLSGKKPTHHPILLWSLVIFCWVSCRSVVFVLPRQPPRPPAHAMASAKGGSPGAAFVCQAKILLLLMAAVGFAVNTLAKISPCEPTYFHFRCHLGRLSRLFIGSQNVARFSSMSILFTSPVVVCYGLCSAGTISITWAALRLRCSRSKPYSFLPFYGIMTLV